MTREQRGCEVERRKERKKRENGEGRAEGN